MFLQHVVIVNGTYLPLFISHVETFHKQIVSPQTDQNNYRPNERLDLTFSLPGMVLKIDSSLEKGLKLKVRRFSGLIPAFVEVSGINPY